LRTGEVFEPQTFMTSGQRYARSSIRQDDVHDIAGPRITKVNKIFASTINVVHVVQLLFLSLH